MSDPQTPSNAWPEPSNDETSLTASAVTPISNPETEAIVLPNSTEMISIPPTARPTTSSKPTGGSLQPSKSEKEALRNFEEAIGGREELMEILNLAAHEPEQQNLVRLMSDPKRDRDNLAGLCAQVGMRPSTLLVWFRQASLARAHTLAVKELADRLPAVMRDVTDKSVDREVPCPKCQGAMLDAEGETCSKCHGSGVILKESDIERQKLLMEAAGITGKRPGIQITQQVAVGTGGGGSIFSRVIKSADPHAYAAAEDIIDVEPLPDEES